MQMHALGSLGPHNQDDQNKGSLEDMFSFQLAFQYHDAKDRYADQYALQSHHPAQEPNATHRALQGAEDQS
jgi:hypothetical protein